MDVKLIVIDPGHSDVDPGAVGFVEEQDHNEKVSAYQKDYLLKNFVCQVYVVESSVNSVRTVAEIANDMKADFLCSNHFNAAGGDGYEALVYSEKRIPIGKIFEKHVLAAGQNSRGVKIRPDLGVLYISNMPAILNEGAFVDNWNDIKDWDEDHELKKLGIAYAEATAEYLELPRKNAEPEEPAKPEEPVNDTYTLEQFILDVQAATGATVDGVAGPETIGKTVTVSRYINDTHRVVKPIQKRLKALGYTQVGEIDGEAGKKFEAAMMAFQEKNHCWVDGEATAAMKTWRKLLGME